MGRRTHDPTAEDDDQCFGHHRDLIASTMSRCQIYEWQLPSFGTLTTSTFAEIRRRGKLARVIGNLTSPGPTKILILYWAMQDRKQLEAAVDRRSSAHQKLPARKHKEKIRSQMLTTPPRNQPPPPPPRSRPFTSALGCRRQIHAGIMFRYKLERKQWTNPGSRPALEELRSTCKAGKTPSLWSPGIWRAKRQAAAASRSPQGLPSKTVVVRKLLHLLTIF